MAEERLESFRGTVRAPAWVGFFTPQGEQYAAPLPVEMTTRAIWSTGPSLTHYVRSLKELRPVVVAVSDARRVRLFRYADRAAVFLETLRAQVSIEPAAHISRPPRAGFHTDTRGKSGADAAQKELQEGLTRLLAETADRIAILAEPDAWVVVGGIPTVAVATLERCLTG
jgi:hypothetical protein